MKKEASPHTILGLMFMPIFVAIGGVIMDFNFLDFAFFSSLPHLQ